jgi:fluoride ion exporter CrcB/FEX
MLASLNIIPTSLFEPSKRDAKQLAEDGSDQEVIADTDLLDQIETQVLKKQNDKVMDKQQLSLSPRIVNQQLVSDASQEKTLDSNLLYSDPTFDSYNSHDEENPRDDEGSLYSDVRIKESLSRISSNGTLQGNMDSDAGPAGLDENRFCLDLQLIHLQQVAYISCFALLGTVLRIYMGRLFGHDCEYKDSPYAVDDFLTPLSEKICITSSGQTASTGGALFTDLPANMLGCFLVGLVTPSITGYNIPWFRKEHSLQQNELFFHAALKVGFCGSLTSFSSWNTQMVIMMDGSKIVLGSQVPAALFGYASGIMCSISSFVFGKHVHIWWSSIHKKHDSAPELMVPCELPVESDKEDSVKEPLKARSCMSATALQWEWLMQLAAFKVTPFVVAGVLVAAFVFAGEVEGIPFYQKLWVSALLAPIGANLRWVLARLNSSKGYWKSLEFIPWGTFIANLVACVFSIIAETYYLKYSSEESTSSSQIIPLAIQMGLSGSLSTVSVFVTELTAMETPAKAYLYGVASIMAALLMSLTIYAPLIRS